MRSRERLFVLALVALVLGTVAASADARKKVPTATTAKFSRSK